MTTEHAELRALAGAYVLGALDRNDRRDFEAHMSSCVPCAEDARALQRIGERLAHTAPDISPPAALRHRVLSAVGVEVTDSSRRRTHRHKRSTVPVWLPYVATVAVTLAFAIYVSVLRARISELDTQLSEATTAILAESRALEDARRTSVQTQSTMAVLMAPNLQPFDLSGQAAAPNAKGRALWSRDRGMVFTATDLPPLPPDRVYEVWLVTSDALTKAGLVTPDAAGRALAVFLTPGNVSDPIAVAVTIEPTGGVPEPTNDRYVLLGRTAPPQTDPQAGDTSR